MARMKCWQKDCKWHWPLATVAALALLVPGAARASCGMLGSPPTVQPAIVTPNLGGNGDGSVNVGAGAAVSRSEEHTSELQSRENLVCRLLLEKKKKKKIRSPPQKKKKKNKID